MSEVWRAIDGFSKYGVYWSCMWHVINGDSWKWLPQRHTGNPYE